MFLTQFFGALNDNLFKNALLVMIVSATIAGANGNNTNMLVNIAAGLFVLPFFLFSAIFGQLADKFEKSRVIRAIKFAEILIMSAGFVALWFQSLYLLLSVLFFMGMQSAFFGPVKYAILPQHLGDDELVAGNALVTMGTFVAILVGTIMGSLMGGAEQPLWLVGGTVMVVAVIGWLSSRHIPVAEAKAAGLHIDWHIPRVSWGLIRLSMGNPPVFLAILGISWFWMLGASYLTQIPNFTVTVLHGTPGIIALILSAFTVGIAIGSLLCDKLSGHKLEIGLVPFGSLGLSLFGVDLYFASQAYTGVDGIAPLGFLLQSSGQRILLDIAMIGMAGGIYIVPLYSMVQARTDDEKRARFIACNNILNSLFVVFASLLGIALLGMANISIPHFFLVIALMNVVVSAFIFFQVPEFTMRFLVWLLGLAMYRIERDGLEHIPSRGAAIIVCNHVSYVDAPLLAGAVRRPIRFIMFKPIYDLPLLNFIFRTGKAIPICSRQYDEATYLTALDEIAEALEQGHLLCIFPEGRLTDDGEIHDFKTGIERILSRNPVPVVPMALQGLWGSLFSRAQRGEFENPLRRLWGRVRICAGMPMEPSQVTAEVLQQKVADLRGGRQ
jgi:1-acyl-sn-glycerol-3-phosphate acyltransferase